MYNALSDDGDLLHIEVSKLYDQHFAKYVRSINLLFIINFGYLLYSVIDENGCPIYRGVGVLIISIYMLCLILGICFSIVIYSRKYHMSYHKFGRYDYPDTIEKIAIDIYCAYFKQIMYTYWFGSMSILIQLIIMLTSINACIRDLIMTGLVHVPCLVFIMYIAYTGFKVAQGIKMTLNTDNVESNNNDANNQMRPSSNI